MRAVILAGGEATRLRPLTCNTAKIMVPILNRPLLEYLITYLKKHSIVDIIIALGKQVEQIQSYFGDGSKFGLRIAYSVEHFPMGTAGAVKNAQSLLDESFIVFNGDIFTDIDLTAMMDFHCEKKASVSIALTPVADPTIYGVVETDAGNRVKRFVEKPSWEKVTTNMINAGIYILEPEILNYIPPKVFFTFERNVFPAALERRQAIYGYPSEAYWIDIGTPEKYLGLNHDLLQRYPHPALSIAGEGLGEEVKFESESTVHPLAQIEGPTIIGESCFIGKNSIIRGPVALGSGCQIEESATVEGAVLWQNCKVGRGAKLRSCVVASNCYIGEESEVLDGCVLGDNVRIGRGSKLSQGIKIWPDKSIEANTISF